MKSYSQRDPLWSNIKIGATQQTIGLVGCLITSIADVSTFFGSNYTPYSIMRSCKFDADARLLWESASFSNFKFEKREHFYSIANVATAIQDPNRAVVIEFNNGAHWCAPIRWNLLLNCWSICDPWLGDIATARRYKNNITGAAYFVRI